MLFSAKVFHKRGEGSISLLASLRPAIDVGDGQQPELSASIRWGTGGQLRVFRGGIDSYFITYLWLDLWAELS